MEVRPAKRDPSENGGVASVAKALAILDVVGEHGPTSLVQLVAATGLPKSTLFRLLATMCDAGYLERTARGEYAPTVKLWRIGAKAIDYDRIHLEVISTLRQIVEETTETAHFSIYEDGYAVYVEKVEGTHPVHAYTHVGGRSPAYASATGKALLAFQPAEEILRIAERAEPHTRATLRGHKALAKEMASIRETNVAVNHGEWRDGVWGVASAVFDHRGEVAGAMGLSGPQDRIEPALDRLSRLVVEHARVLTARYGGGRDLAARAR
jgi:DNA-binding IclR family transcriptional regulator